jgi:hypothetical protein
MPQRASAVPAPTAVSHSNTGSPLQSLPRGILVWAGHGLLLLEVWNDAKGNTSQGDEGIGSSSSILPLPSWRSLQVCRLFSFLDKISVQHKCCNEESHNVRRVMVASLFGSRVTIVSSEESTIHVAVIGHFFCAGGQNRGAPVKQRFHAGCAELRAAEVLSTLEQSPEVAAFLGTNVTQPEEYNSSSSMGSVNAAVQTEVKDTVRILADPLLREGCLAEAWSLMPAIDGHALYALMTHGPALLWGDAMKTGFGTWLAETEVMKAEVELAGRILLHMSAMMTCGALVVAQLSTGSESVYTCIACPGSVRIVWPFHWNVVPDSGCPPSLASDCECFKGQGPPGGKNISLACKVFAVTCPLLPSDVRKAASSIATHIRYSFSPTSPHSKPLTSLFAPSSHLSVPRPPEAVPPSTRWRDRALKSFSRILRHGSNGGRWNRKSSTEV